MATEQKPILLYILINITMIAIIIVSTVYVYTKFFADKLERDEKITYTKENESSDLSTQLSSMSFKVAAILALLFITIYVIMKTVSRTARPRY